MYDSASSASARAPPITMEPYKINFISFFLFFLFVCVLLYKEQFNVPVRKIKTPW